jgi:hypothetical protein
MERNDHEGNDHERNVHERNDRMKRKKKKMNVDDLVPYRMIDGDI